jgi:two-component system, OmpR family, alkaline phosphatase synthesis response regulator PhoP
MIFCVEDDSGIRELMIYALNAAGYETVGFSESLSFWEKMKTELPQLIILDIMLPGEDGISILRKLRSSPITSDIPVIVATAKGSEFDKVIGLDLGADDYLVKPFGMMEMVSRIKAVLRRTQPKNESPILNVGSVMMDEKRHIVFSDNKEVSLTLKEYDLLKLFMTNKGRVYTRDQLLSAIWGIDFSGETRTVDVHVGTLRTKLGNAGNLIKTVRGVGYKMEADV